MDENKNEFTQPLTEEPPKKKKKKGTFFKVLAVVLVCCLVGGLLAVGGQEIYTRYQSGGVKGIFTPNSGAEADGNEKTDVPDIVIVSPDANESPAPKAKEEAKEEPKVEEKTEKKADKEESGDEDMKLLTASELYERNVDAMVSISTQIQGYNAWGQKVQGAAAGSGFIVSEEGYVLTNYHVIESSRSINVITYDGKSYDATVIGYDESNDVAVLKVNSDDKFAAVSIGDSDKCKVGEDVVAIGNALGELDFSMTRGIISGLARDVKVSSNHTMTLIQTDCTINSGNSGGALFNMYGDVIGITNAKYSSAGSYGEAAIENVAFAIPINSVIEIVRAIVSGENMTTPYIGVTVSDISTDVKNATGIEKGAYIADVGDDTPAQKAGIEVGDIIVAADGKEIEDYEALSAYISSCAPDDEIDLQIIRQGKEVELKVKVGARANTNVVMGEDAQNAFSGQEEEQDKQGQNDFQFSYGGDNGGSGSQYYGGYGSMPDIFSYIFGNYGYGY